MTLLAQSIPPAADLAAFLGCVAFLLGIAVAIKKLRAADPAPLPQPLTVKEHKRFATFEELQSVRVELRGISTRFDEAVAQIRRDGEGRTAGIEQHIDELKTDIKADNQILHGRITELLAAFAEFRGEARAKLPH